VKHYKSVEILLIFRMSIPPHKRKTPRRTGKRPYWTLSGDGSVPNSQFSFADGGGPNTSTTMQMALSVNIR